MDAKVKPNVFVSVVVDKTLSDHSVFLYRIQELNFILAVFLLTLLHYMLISTDLSARFVTVYRICITHRKVNVQLCKHHRAE